MNTGRICDQLKILTGETRLKILLLLEEEPHNLAFFEKELGTAQPMLSRDLALLHASGCVERTRRGKWVDYSLTDQGRKLVRVARYIESTQSGLLAG